MEKTYTTPRRLFTSDNAKTVKGEKRGYKTHILYLAPGTQNSLGINICPFSSPGCRSACLYKSGLGGFTKIQKGRLNKSEYFVRDQSGFVHQLHKEICHIKKKYRPKGFIPVFRLNGTSDIDWGSLNLIDGKNLFQLHPDVQFYDYTKDPNRVSSNTYHNYYLVFSHDERNWVISKELLDDGTNVAVVFNTTSKDELPSEYKGFPVICGDKDDLRFLDPPGAIVGLVYKCITSKGSAVTNVYNINKNPFIARLSGNNSYA